MAAFIVLAGLGPLATPARGQTEPGSAAHPAAEPIRPIKSILAVLEFQSSTLTPAEEDAFGQVIWTEFYRSPETFVLPLKETRSYLLQRNLYPGLPYGSRVELGDIAEVLKADYVIWGHINKVGRTFAIDYSLYSAHLDEMISIDSVFRRGDPGELLVQVPSLASAIMRAIQWGESIRRGEATRTQDRPQDARQAIRRRAEEAERHRRETHERDASLVQMPPPVKTPRPDSKVIADTTPPARPSPSPVPAAHEAPQESQPVMLASTSEATPTPVPAETHEPPEDHAPTPGAPPDVIHEPEPTPVERVVQPPAPTPEAIPEAELPPPPVETPVPTPSPSPTPRPTATPVPTPRPTPTLTPVSESVITANNKKAAAEAFEESRMMDPASTERIVRLNDAVRLDPTVGDYRKALATSYYYVRDYERCVEQCREAVLLVPKDSMLLTLLGAAHFELDEFDAAREAQEQALAADQNNLYALFNLALALQAQGSPKTLETWEDFLKRSEGDEEQTRMGHRQRAEKSYDTLKKEQESKRE